MPVLMNLNVSQAEAVCHSNGPALVLAGPGSGKTTVITCRIQYLIDHYHIPAEDILAVTFSRKAADHMKDRFFQLHQGNGLPFFGTFHSIFFMILRFAYNLTTRNIITEAQKYAIITEETEKLSLEYEDAAEFAGSLLHEISKVKTGAVNLNSYLSSTVPPASFRILYAKYEKALADRNLIDFDDMLSLCLDLLSERSDILGYWQSRFQYILADEFQDINPIQYRILKLLALPQNNLFAVGDDDQSIYAFRGSSPGIMTQFLKDFPDAFRITLDTNYRCGKVILDKAKTMIQYNRHRLEKQQETCPETGAGKFSVCRCKTQQEEYERIAQDIEQLLKDGADLEEIAVLVRRSLEMPWLLQVLANHGIGADTVSGAGVARNHFIAGDFQAYQRLAAGFAGRRTPDVSGLSPGSSNEISSPENIQKDLSRIINKPSRFITKKTLQQVFEKEHTSAVSALCEFERLLCKNPHKQEAVRRLAYHLQVMANLSPFAQLQYLRFSVGYEKYLKELAGKTHRSVDSYMVFMETLAARLSNSSSESNLIGSAVPDVSRPKIRLLTMHASKGLEFQHVFIPDVNEDVLPAGKAETAEMIEEERRIFYVAMTRASRSLRIYYAETIRSKKAAPSRFLDCFSSTHSFKSDDCTKAQRRIAESVYHIEAPDSTRPLPVPDT